MNDEKPRLSELPEKHQHIYHVVSGSFTVRYCEVCGQSWLLTQLYGDWYWNEIAEKLPEGK